METMVSDDAERVPSHLEKLERTYECGWSHIKAAKEASSAKLMNLHEQVCIAQRELRPDASLVVFGSLARGEITPGSDLDWALLIDGQADGEDHRAVKRITKIIRELGEKDPGPSGFFGGLMFSHTLVHDIGGPSDSYVNTTRRVLMLLESASIGRPEVRDRVMRAILKRYIDQQTHYKKSDQNPRPYIPRFLLNDVVRYWRTIAVDYANKVSQGDGTGWAVRNIKLRMSRKLLFVAGLLICFESHFGREQLKRDNEGWLFPFEQFPKEPETAPYVNLLFDIARLSPLEILAHACERFSSKATGALIFGSYDRFLGRLSNEACREELKNLTYEQSKNNALFNELRDVGHEFQKGLQQMFFFENQELAGMMREYAVF